jgi:hypothetical protein
VDGARIGQTAGIGQSWLDELIHDLERMTNSTIGLSSLVSPANTFEMVREKQLSEQQPRFLY